MSTETNGSIPVREDASRATTLANRLTAEADRMESLYGKGYSVAVGLLREAAARMKPRKHLDYCPAHPLIAECICDAETVAGSPRPHD